ncbi:PTS sugar transporter subunit IIB [Abyssisolibacter fermentans]|uniref:PTS sugar transporter subunit IIB n=1 Tax=Abyssisolibacter fermentans TaxID=1766203 RepID=UPI00082E35F8|nr:PTS sugar transporter subunit IIB [Abyssisolibacter fermentans]
MKFRILSVCGTGIATSTVAAENCKKLLKARGLDVEVIECRVTEVATKVPVFMPHVIVHTTPVSDSAAGGVKKFLAIPFLTGIGGDNLADAIAEHLKSLDK